VSLSRLNDPVSTGKKNNLFLGQPRPVAEATIVEISIQTVGKGSDHFVRIVDDGHGMDDQDVEGSWLRLD
jgi:hypothetical protein